MRLRKPVLAIATNNASEDATNIEIDVGEGIYPVDIQKMYYA